MKRACLIVSFAVMASCVLAGVSFGGPWGEFAVYPNSNPLLSDQEKPDICEMTDAKGSIFHRIVWQQLAKIEGTSDWHWDIWGGDMTAEEIVIYPVAQYPAPDESDPFASNQENPAVFEDKIVWQDDYWGDYDIYVVDIGYPSGPIELALTPYPHDQSNPAVSGNIVVWQEEAVWQTDQGQDMIDWDIWGADVTDPNYAEEFTIAALEADQQAPAVFRNNVVWEDHYYPDSDLFVSDVWQRNNPVSHAVSLGEDIDEERPAVWGDIAVWQERTGGQEDIWAADVSDPENPRRFAVCQEAHSQTNPDVGDNLVVWQDFRNGHDWDIYGYNLTTGQEFQITDDDAHQMNPAVAGNVVVWQDIRDGYWQIYAAELYGAEVARCEVRVAGDVTGDCMVNIRDLAELAAGWLDCGLDTPEACGFAGGLK